MVNSKNGRVVNSKNERVANSKNKSVVNSKNEHVVNSKNEHEQYSENQKGKLLNSKAIWPNTAFIFPIGMPSFQVDSVLVVGFSQEIPRP